MAGEKGFGKQEQLQRLILERMQHLVSIMTTMSATNRGVVVGNGIYQEDVSDSTILNGSLRLRKIQEVSDTEVYMGYSTRGTADADTSWLLVHVLMNQGTGSDETWMTVAVDSWDNRATASYA